MAQHIVSAADERRREDMAQVGIVMGSDSDMAVMSKAADILEDLGISYEMSQLMKLQKYMQEARKKFKKKKENMKKKN